MNFSWNTPLYHKFLDISGVPRTVETLIYGMISANLVHFRGTKNSWSYDIIYWYRIRYHINYYYIMTYIRTHEKHQLRCTHPRRLTLAVPEDYASEDDDDSDRDHWLPDQHDDDDFGHGSGPGPSRAQARPLDPLTRFIQELEDLSSMNCPDISAAVNDLPLPQEGDVSCVPVQGAVTVSSDIMHDVA
jgi:hypothetical protein